MAAVRVRRDDYEDGVLPQVCVLTGGPGEVLVEHRSAAGAGPAVLLLLLLGPVGVVVMLVVDHLMKVEASGLVPMSRSAHEARRAFRRRCDRVALGGGLAAVVGVLGLVARTETPTVFWALLAGGVVLAAGGWFAPAIGGLRGRPDRTGRHVTLTGVDPAFAAAYRAQDDRRAEARRAAVVAPTGPAPSRRRALSGRRRSRPAPAAW